MRNAPTTVEAAHNLIADAIRRGFRIEIADESRFGFIQKSFSGYSHYSGASYVFVVTFRNSGPGRRASARIAVTRRNSARKTVREAGVWAGFFWLRQLSDDIKSWNKHVAIQSGSFESANL